jgi:hypothetical protein
MPDERTLPDSIIGHPEPSRFGGFVNQCFLWPFFTTGLTFLTGFTTGNG